MRPPSLHKSAPTGLESILYGVWKGALISEFTFVYNNRVDIAFPCAVTKEKHISKLSEIIITLLIQTLKEKLGKTQASHISSSEVLLN